MRVLRLGSNYVLAKNGGFTHAVRFDRQCSESDDLRRALNKLHADAQPWNRWWGRNNQTAPWGYYQDSSRRSSPYWIGVKNPVDLTAAILMVNDV